LVGTVDRTQQNNGVITYSVDIDHYLDKMELQERQGFSSEILSMTAKHIKKILNQ
jgi:hypothetical protein